MINPSASGWIDKYFLKRKSQNDKGVLDAESFYHKIRLTGFIYGHVVSVDANTVDLDLGWTRDEISKLALLNALFGIYQAKTKDDSPERFIAHAVMFYDEMNPKGFSLFKKVFGSKPSANLEEIIHDRVQTNQDIISRNFSHVVTNALLFIDVLAFQRFLLNESIPSKYLKKIEETIITVISLALKTKTSKSPHDNMLIKLFEASVRYGKFAEGGIASVDELKLDYFSDRLEKYYFVDIAAMVLWSDGKIENDEYYFLQKLAESMQIDESFIAESVHATDAFIRKYRHEIPYFNYSNPVKHFYDNLTQSVIVLITRNKKRLTKEISQSRELMVLLAQSTQRDLDSREKKKIKNQILEICKTIPSLTIFLLPGGSLLLPILIKFIPQLLPSTFNENHDTE